jgi:hypothetical protein
VIAARVAAIERFIGRGLWRAYAVVVPAALLLAACGGGDGDEDGGGPAGKDDFLASVNAVCIDRAKQINDQFNEQVNPTTAQEFAELLPRRVEIEEATVEELEGVEPPAELADAYKTYVTREHRVADGYQVALNAANQVDTPAFVDANKQLDQAELAAARSAADAGLGDCANHLPADETADLKVVIEDIWVRANPAHCTEDYTSALVEELGGQDACEQGEVPKAEADSVEIGTISGNSRVTASADVVIHGGTHNGEENQQAFEYEDGRWKLDQVFVTKAPSK